MHGEVRVSSLTRIAPRSTSGVSVPISVPRAARRVRDRPAGDDHPLPLPREREGRMRGMDDHPCASSTTCLSGSPVSFGPFPTIRAMSPVAG